MKAYIVLPIYNISVNDDVLNTEFIDGYKIISNKTFFDEYKNKVINTHTALAHWLEEDIVIPVEGMMLTRPLAKYLIIKEQEIENDYYNKIFNAFRNSEKGMLNHLLLALRLTQKGRCQVHRCYLFTQNTQGSIFIDFSTTNLECMYGWLSTKESLFEDIYEFTKETVQKLKKTCLIVRPYSEEAIVPVGYFMQYYNTISTYDRIIKLAIVLESSVLAGLEQELNYRLKLRATAFLKQDCRKMLDILYQIRSCIVHNGCIKKECFVDLKKFLKDKDCSDTKAIFVFIKDYIEPLVRKILYKSFEEFSKNDKMENFSQLFSKVDNMIINHLTN